MAGGHVLLALVIAMTALFSPALCGPFHGRGSGRWNPSRSYSRSHSQSSSYSLKREELNCDKTVPRYIPRAIVDKVPQFWVDLNDRLKADQCHEKSATGCKQSHDKAFKKIANYVSNLCDNDVSDPDLLERLVLGYCKKHRGDVAVQLAYNCTTGCPLNDHINQVCHSRGLVLDCPDPEFDLLIDQCYSLQSRVDGLPVNWTSALVICLEKQSLLARINSAEENAAIQTFVGGESSFVWIGLNRLVEPRNFNWLGSTGMDVLYSPNNPPSKGPCVWFVPSDASWDNQACDDPAGKRFLCQKSAELMLNLPGVRAGETRPSAAQSSGTVNSAAVLPPSDRWD